MKDSIVVESGGPPDFEQLLVLIRMYYEYDDIPFAEDRARPAIARLLADPVVGRIWIMRDQDLAIGYVVATFGFDFEFAGRDMTVTDVFLKEEYRGRRLGRRLLATVDAFCRIEKIAAIHLQVVHGNDRARAFYEKLGFVAHDRTAMTRWL